MLWEQEKKEIAASLVTLIERETKRSEVELSPIGVLSEKLRQIKTSRRSREVLLSDQRTDIFPVQGIPQGGCIPQIENKDGKLIFHAESHRGAVHYFQAQVEHLNVRKFAKFLCLWVLLRIGVVDPIDLGSLDHNICIDLGGAQGCGGIGGKEGNARSRTENDDAIFLEMTDSPAADVWLRDRPHLAGRHDPSEHIDPLALIHTDHSIHHDSQQPH